MAFSDQLSALNTHATAAGAALTNPIKDVAIAWPSPSGSRCIRLWYGGEDDPPGFSSRTTLTEELVGERVVLTAFWSLSNLSTAQAAVVEQELYDLKHEIRTRVNADTELGGQAQNVVQGDATTDFVVIGQTPYRTLEIEFVVAYTSYPLAD